MQNIPEWQSRTAIILGPEGVRKLAAANVLVVGVGGVGAMAAEMLCRAGVGKMTIVDGDVVEATNRNRQLPALVSSDGMAKTDVMFHRLKDINPECDVRIVCEFLKDDRMTDVLTAEKYDYVVDAIDTLSPKAHLIRICRENGVKIVSSMGSGARLDPTAVRVADIAESYNCPPAKAIRRRLRRLESATASRWSSPPRAPWRTPSFRWRTTPCKTSAR